MNYNKKYDVASDYNHSEYYIKIVDVEPTKDHQYNHQHKLGFNEKYPEEYTFKVAERKEIDHIPSN